MSWQWYKNPNVFRVFIHCLLKANHKDNKFEGKIIPRGSLATSYDSIAQDLKLSRQEVRTAIKKLKDTKEVVTNSTPRWLLVTFVKYNDYQGRDAKNNTLLTPDQHPSNTLLTPNNNDNNDNNDNNIIEIEKMKKNSLADSNWVEAAKNNFALSEKDFNQFITNFTNHALINGHTHMSAQEYRQHFVRWYKKTTGKGMNGRKVYKYKKPSL